MKNYSIDFSVRRSDGSLVFAQTFSVVSQNIFSASVLLEKDLLLLVEYLPADFKVIYNLSKIYCND